MRQLALALALFALVAAQSSDGNGGEVCNFQASGDEVVENAVPIATFRTSGNNATRRSWCIAYCQDRTSLKATMLFQPSTPVTAKFKRFVDRTDKGEKFVSFKQTDGFPVKHRELHDESCKDLNIDLKIDEVFIKYQGIDQITQMLDKTINKPGWAYLVYELIPDAGGLITTENAVVDDNFCMMTKSQKDSNGVRAEYQVFAGLVKDN